jgi:hypothetical protein
MADYLNDAFRHLKDALEEGNGFEEGLFIDVLLEAATEFNVELKTIRKEVEEPERNLLGYVFDLSSRCLNILRENGVELVNRFNAQCKEMAGESYENWKGEGQSPVFCSK